MTRRFSWKSLFSKEKPLRSYLFLLAVFAMMAAVPVLSAWLLNAFQDTAQDLPIPLILSTLAAALVAAMFVRQYRRDPLGGYVGGLFIILVISTNYQDRLNAVASTVKAINPVPKLDDYQDLLASIIFLLILFFIGKAIGAAISKYIAAKKWRALDLCGGLTVAISIIFALQLFPTVRTLVVEWPQYFYRPPALNTSATTAVAKPDVYYIVLDRYTSQQILSTQFGFDNSPFTNFLTQNGFSVNPDAHQNYPYTTMSIASTLNADYHTDQVEKFAGASLQTVEPYHDSIRYAPVIQQFKAEGYTYDQLGSWYEASNQAPLADHNYQPDGIMSLFGYSITLNSFGKNQLQESIFWRLIEKGISLGSHSLLSYSSISEADATLYKLNVLKDIANQPVGSKFVFAHFLIPHDPYYYNADGSLNSSNSNDNVGEPIKQKYVNQVQFINSQMETLVSEINKNTNGQAVIIIQSDEGPYPQVLNDQNFNGDVVGSDLATGSMLDMSRQDLLMKYGILAAYHIPLATPEASAAGDDSVNIFRVVMNTYFQTNLPYLPRCYYAYPDGRDQPFVYTDITQRLTGTANPLCSPTSDFSKPSSL